jgi:hypothetical protein
MKTTSRLGGRKAHTARGRRVRYETSTRVLKARVAVRMIRSLLHAFGRTTSGPARTDYGVWGTGRGGDAARVVHRRYGSVTAPRSAPVTRRAYLARTPVV